MFCRAWTEGLEQSDMGLLRWCRAWCVAAVESALGGGAVGVEGGGSGNVVGQVVSEHDVRTFARMIVGAKSMCNLCVWVCLRGVHDVRTAFGSLSL